MSGVVRLYEHGGPEVLRYESESVGAPGAGQVRLRQEAVGVNFVDTYFRSGAFPLPALPAVIGGEAAGVVDAVGSDVTSVAVGDRVGYYFSLGSYAEQRLIAAADLVPLPDDVSAVDAAAVLAKGLTAWGRLRDLRPGATVVVTGATGGVGSVLAPWAQHLGATVLTPVASAGRVETARALGLKHVVVAGELASVAPDGVDVVYDLVGRATFAESVAVLRPGGTLDLIGAASGQPDLGAVDLSGFRVTRSSTGDHLPDRPTLLAAATEVFQAWRDGVFGARQVHTYPLAEAPDAHRALAAGVSGAAIVLVP